MPKPNETPWTILHIDDDEDDYILTRDLLSQAQGRKVTLDWSRSLAEGQQKLAVNQYDAVIVDYDLGIGSGIELIREAVDQGCSTPLILYTGRGSYDVDMEAMRAGATLYLTKGEVSPLLMERSIRYAIERKQVEADLLENDRKLRVALDAAQLGTWTYHFDDHMLEMDERAQHLYRAESRSVDHNSIVNRFFDPLDSIVMYERLQAASDPNGDGRYQAEYRIYQPDGSYCWLSAWGLVQFEGRGTDRRAVSLTGATRDITHEKIASEALQESAKSLKESEERFRSVLENSLDVAYRRNLQTDQYDYMSPVVEQILGFSTEEMLAMNMNELVNHIHPDDQERLEDELHIASQTGKGKLIYRFRCKDGRYRWMADYVTVLKGAAGEPLYRGGILRDITENRQATEKLAFTA